MLSKKKLFFGLILILLGIVLSSCLSKMVKLEEVYPEGGEPKSEEAEKIAPVTGMIAEIEEVGGEQKYIYIKLGSKIKGVRKGRKGHIYNDPAMTEKIGKFQIIEVFPDFSKGKILELNYKIKDTAIVLIEVDPRHLIK